MPSVFQRLEESIEREQLVGLATIVSGEEMGEKILVFPGGRFAGKLSSSALLEPVLEEAARLLETHETASFEVDGGQGERVEVFFEAYPPPQKLIVVGAVHVAIPLVSIAKTLGFRTVVVDARSVYATKERFPHVDELIVKWPAEALQSMNLHESTYCVFLTHDPKLDNPGLELALRSSARYVGALGSKKTHANRVSALRELGLSDQEISRIHAPIGIKLGGNRPEEIALSIAAEIVAARHGRA